MTHPSGRIASAIMSLSGVTFSLPSTLYASVEWSFSTAAFVTLLGHINGRIVSCKWPWTTTRWSSIKATSPFHLVTGKLAKPSKALTYALTTCFQRRRRRLPQPPGQRALPLPQITIPSSVKSLTLPPAATGERVTADTSAPSAVTTIP